MRLARHFYFSNNYNHFVVIIVFLYDSLIVYKWQAQLLANLKVLKDLYFCFLLRCLVVVSQRINNTLRCCGIL